MDLRRCAPTLTGQRVPFELPESPRPVGSFLALRSKKRWSHDGERGLADPRLAGDQEHATVTLDRILQPRARPAPDPGRFGQPTSSGESGGTVVRWSY